MKFKKRFYLPALLLSTSLLIFLLWLWTRGGFPSFTLDTDFGRDLHQLSNIWQGKIVWLGPRLSAGFHASPIYYYLFFPALKLAGGHPYSLLVFNLILATLSLLVFIWLGFKKHSYPTLIAAALIGLSPVWMSIVFHPGNGFTYVIWLLFYLTTLWFKLPLWTSSLFLGLAVSFHPAAILLIGPLIYQWWQSQRSLKKLSIVFLGLLIPWLPIIIFEIITRAFLVRQWLAQPTVSGITFQPNLSNLKTISSQAFFTPWLSLLVVPALYSLSNKRLKGWLLTLSPPLLMVLFLSPLPAHYLFPLSLSLVFLFSISSLQSKLAKPLLYIFLCVSVITQLLKPAPPPSHRNISRLLQTTNRLTQNTKLQEPLAVLAVLGPTGKVPQADAYRFFLRLKGYKTLPVNQYSQAQTLIIFLEDKDFNWRQWQTWETTQFGPKKLIYQQTIQGTKVLVFQSVQ